jgi:hypothetical protein
MRPLPVGVKAWSDDDDAFPEKQWRDFDNRIEHGVRRGF